MDNNAQVILLTAVMVARESNVSKCKGPRGTLDSKGKVVWVSLKQHASSLESDVQVKASVVLPLSPWNSHMKPPFNLG